MPLGSSNILSKVALKSTFPFRKHISVYAYIIYLRKQAKYENYELVLLTIIELKLSWVTKSTTSKV
jgi:hypothetical protein